MNGLYLKILYLSFFEKEGEGELLKVKLNNVKPYNEECHNALRIYFVIIYYSPLKTNNRAIIFAI